MTRIERTRITTEPVVTSAQADTRLTALREADQFLLPALENLVQIVRRELKIAKGATDKGFAYSWDGATGPVQAILLDPLLPVLAPDQRAQRVQRILEATRPASTVRVWGPLLAGMGLIAALFAFSVNGLFSGLAAVALSVLIIFAMNMPGPGRCAHLEGRKVIVPVQYPQISFGEAMELAGHMKQFHESRTGHQEKSHDHKAAEQYSAPLTRPKRSSRQLPAKRETAAGPRRTTVEDIDQSRSDLLAAWANYKLDRDAWYFTKPLLHDTTGTVATTVAYNEALTNLIVAVDALGPHAPQPRIDAAARLADIAWKAWHDANDYAAHMGLGDRTPTERAALERLGKLVERLTRSAAADPELPMIKRGIQDCLDKITTVSVSWADIASLPEIEAAGLLPQLPTHDHSVGE